MALFSKTSKPVVLLIMDGVGIAPPGPGNAVTLADTPNLDKLWPKYPHGSLQAAGTAVGLSEGVDGNSEVGHLNIGIGKVIFQELPLIDRKIKNGEFDRNTELLNAIDFAKKNNGKLHVLGLVGWGKVHSSLDHLYRLIDLIAKQNFNPEKLLLFPILDGRDCSPSAGLEVLQEIEAELQRQRIGRIAGFIGRYFAMDRDERWDRTQQAYEMMTLGKGEKISDIKTVLQKRYRQGMTDEFMTAHVLPNFKGEIEKVQPGDAVINFSFRPDREIQITQAFEDSNFKEFPRNKLENIYYVGFSNYGKNLPTHIAFPKEKVSVTLGSVLSQNQIGQLRLAESEKYPHVTYFFDGSRQIVFPGEVAIEVPSPKNVASYDQAPEMSTRKIVEVALKQLQDNNFGFAIINFAATDMVAHTGVLDAAIKAMEVVDWGVGEITRVVLKKGGVVLVTADHGNCEELINLRSGEVDTKHSSNLVPLLIVGKEYEAKELQLGCLCDLAPTVLNIMGIQKPPEMTGRNLLV